MSAGERGSTWLPAQGAAPDAAFDDLLDAVHRRAQALATADASASRATRDRCCRRDDTRPDAVRLVP